MVAGNTFGQDGDILTQDWDVPMSYRSSLSQSCWEDNWGGETVLYNKDPNLKLR